MRHFLTRGITCLQLVMATCFAQEQSDPQSQAEQALVSMLQKQLQTARDKGIQKEIQLSSQEIEPSSCSTCSSQELIYALDDSQLFVFMSFSVPDSVWLALSQELERLKGTFVVRGIPQQGFQAFAQRIFTLKEKGVNSPIQLHPQAFLTYDVTQVPSFVVVEGPLYDKLNGNVSLNFALDVMAKKGETQAAKDFYQALVEGKT